MAHQSVDHFIVAKVNYHPHNDGPHAEKVYVWGAFRNIYPYPQYMYIMINVINVVYMLVWVNSVHIRTYVRTYVQYVGIYKWYFCIVGIYVCTVCMYIFRYTVYQELLMVIKFGNLPKIWPNALLAEFKFGGLPEWVLIALKFGANLANINVAVSSMTAKSPNLNYH